VLPPFFRGRRIASLTRIPPGLGNGGKLQRGNVQKRVACCQNSLEHRALGPPSGWQNGALSDPRASQNRPKSLPGPILSAGRAEGEKKIGAGEKLTSSFDILGRPGRSKAPFWTPGGFQKWTKIDMARLARHPGAPKCAKRLSKGGSQNGGEKVIEKGSRNESFLDA